MGWTGDAQVFSVTATYLEDTYAFYAKYLYDMWQEQQAADGCVYDVIPSTGVDSFATVWGDASVIIPWNMYEFYGDVSILEDQYESMHSWIDFIKRYDGENHAWGSKFHYGDWLALDHPAGGVDQVMGGTDESFIAYVYFGAMCDLVSKAAGILGKASDCEYYKKLSDKITAYVKREYYSASGRCCINTQTALILTMKYGLSENKELCRKMIEKLFAWSDGKLRTGFVGTPLLCNVLTENGFEELSFKLLLNEEYPGWLREVKLGATTMWERWNTLDDEGRVTSVGMNSCNHYSYGSIAEWMFKHVAGIHKKTDSIGFRNVEITPLHNWELQFMEGEYDSPVGKYRCSWRFLDENHVTLKVSVPFGGTAEVILPYASSDVFTDQSNPLFANIADGRCIVEAGDYEVTYQTVKCFREKFSIHSTIRQIRNHKRAYEGLKAEFDMDVELLPKQNDDISLSDTLLQYRKEVFDQIGDSRNSFLMSL